MKSDIGESTRFTMPRRKRSDENVVWRSQEKKKQNKQTKQTQTQKLGKGR